MKPGYEIRVFIAKENPTDTIYLDQYWDAMLIKK